MRHRRLPIALIALALGGAPAAQAASTPSLRFPRDLPPVTRTPPPAPPTPTPQADGHRHRELPATGAQPALTALEGALLVAAGVGLRLRRRS